MSMRTSPTGAAAAPTVGPLLHELDEAGRYAAFDVLQARLPDVWRLIGSGDTGESVVVVPSMTVDRVVGTAGAINQALEERLLFLLLLLRQPHLRMIYVSSMPVDPQIIEYYLSLLPGVIPSHARSRLTLFSVGDGSGLSLTDKLLARPRMLAELASLVPDRARSHLVPYTSTTRERDLALQLGIPMYAADPRHFPYGTKSGCRRLFTEAGVAHPEGAEDLHSFEDVVDALVRLRASRPTSDWAMVKLDEGTSGSGNALVDLRDIEPTAPDAADRVASRVRTMQLEAETVRLDDYLAKLAERGGIVEERIVGDELRSPSVQLRVTPLGELELLSTHDQVLGGPTGQAYLGARFPADQAYATTITEAARRVGERLAAAGVIGRFALDFVVVRHGDVWEAHAIEVNLRKGGTTHPFLTLQFLTDGAYEPGSAHFLTPSGERRHLVATDHLQDEALKGLRVADLFDLVARAGLQFDPSRQVGIVFHMISSITECGRVGMTAIGATPDSAQDVFDRAESALLAEARASLAPRGLPL